MGRGPSAKGKEDQRRIMTELAVRWESMQPPPTLDILADALDLDRTSVYRHVKALRRRGLLHATAMLLSPAGYAEIRAPK